MLLLIILAVYLAVGIVCAIGQVVIQVLHGNPAARTVGGRPAWGSLTAATLVLSPLWLPNALTYLYMQVRGIRTK